MMKFFTPELYLRYNSADDAVADLADEQWEEALRGDKEFLSENSRDMSDRVRDLADRLSLHDAELLSIQEDVTDTSPDLPASVRFSVATISVREGETITNLIYVVSSPIEQSRPGGDWPFSGLRIHWLYDEVEVVKRPPHPTSYRHEILWSDGRITSVPFLD